jgi:hypothetical protein
LGMAVVVTMLALGLSGLGEGIEGLHWWAGLGCACPVQGGDAPAAELGQGADCDRGAGQCQLRDDRHVAGACRTELDRSAGTDLPSAEPYERIGP